MHDILLVDDQPVNLDFLRALLQQRGHRLHEAADGQQALETAVRVRPRLVITDIVMPRLDGYTLARRLADQPSLADTRMIVYTAAYEEHEARSLLPHCGIWRFLAKPCEPERLLQAVEEALLETGLRAPTAGGTEVAEAQLGVVSDKLHQKITELERLRMLVTALSGYLGSSFSGYRVRFFGIVLPAWSPPWPVAKQAMSSVHLASVRLFMGLPIVHVGAVLRHLLRGDGVAARMGLPLLGEGRP